MMLEVLYANSSHEDGKYLRECVQSARTFKSFLPDAWFVLYTDAAGFRADVFDQVVTVPFVVPESLRERRHFNGQMLVKISAMLERERAQVLVLGSDTYALKQDVRELPPLLERFDIAVAHAPHRINTAFGNSPIPEVPKAFPEFNCDVILFRNTDKVRRVIREWLQRYRNDEFEHPHDQGTFRYVIYKSDLRIATLPPEYNYRGRDVREDTVILQRREMLPKYLYRDARAVASASSSAGAPGGQYLRRAAKRIARLLHA